MSHQGVHAAALVFEGSRADLPERRVPPFLVAEHFVVVEELHLRLAVTAEPLPQLALHRREEALHHRVVVAVALPAHAAHDALRFEDFLVVLARVRAALVGMMQQPDVRTSPLPRHLERFDRQMPIVDRTDRPAHDES